MAPPVKGAGEGNLQGDLSLQAQQAQPAKPEKSEKSTDPDKKRWNPQLFFEVDVAAEDAGQNNDGLFHTGKQGELGDRMVAKGRFGATWNATTGKFRVEIGPWGGVHFLRGGPQTNESSINLYLVGPRASFDWSRAQPGDPVRWLSRVDLDYGIGYGHGDTTAESIRKHQQKGMAHTVRGALEVIGVELPGAELGANINAAYSMVDGRDFNTGGFELGGGIAGRFDLHKKEKIVKGDPVRICHQTVQDITDNRAKVRELLKLIYGTEQKEGLEDVVRRLRGYLENIPQNPFNQANIRKALVLGDVAKLINTNTDVTPDKMQEAIKAANAAPQLYASSAPAAEAPEKEGEGSEKGETKKPPKSASQIIAEKTGLGIAQVEAFIKKAEENYPPDYDKFWALPEHETVDLDSPMMKKALNAEPCDKDADAINKALWELLDKLNDRRVALEKDLGKATHLAGLVLGDFEVGVMFRFMNFRIDPPRYVFARPTDAQVEKLEGAMEGGSKTEADVAKATRGILNAPKFEAKKLKKLADWMLGKGKIPGSEQNEKLFEKMGYKPESAQMKEMGKKVEEEFLKRVVLNVVGHTDNRGSDENNQALSERRARVVTAILKGYGVPEKMLKAFGAGEEFPLCPDNTRDCHDRNRRVEFLPKDLGPGASAPGRENFENYNPDGSPPSELDPDKKDPKSKAKGKDKGKAKGSGKTSKPATSKPDPVNDPFKGLGK